MPSTQSQLNTIITIPKKQNTFSKIVCFIILFISIVLFFAANWYIRKFGNTGFDSIIFTLFSENGGAETDNMIIEYLIKGFVPALISYIAIVFILFLFPKKKDINIKFKKLNIHLLPVKHWCAVCVSLILSFILLITAAFATRLDEYLHGLVTKSTLFEEHYVEPSSVNITFPEEKRNLIYIFLESMETTYFSKEQGGAFDYSLMPELYDLAEDNINFSHTDGVGGFRTPNGTTWTVAAMTAQTSGVPLKESPTFERNKYGADKFLPGLDNLTNILDENGYYQALMVGSDIKFANRDVYYKGHGIDKIYDIQTARDDGIVPKDYHVWWGMEDENLFKYAKRELTSMEKRDEPFAFTLLTVDTHFTDGYFCKLCKNKYDSQYENVISCSSHQVNSFINWIKRQKFYKDTTVVVVGDHLTMDSGFIEKNVKSGYEQRVYNCFINSVAEGTNYKNRDFTSFDMFPTTLAAMGCTIPGERLGLGTNLFSDKKTLAEEMGYDEFNKTLLLNSTYYNENFVK